MKKLTILISGAAGYVLGSRAGRERYEQIKDMALKVKDNPSVQERTQQAADVAKTQAPVVKDKVTDTVAGAAGAAKAKVSNHGSSADGEFPDDSLINADDPYPKGDLP